MSKPPVAWDTYRPDQPQAPAEPTKPALSRQEMARAAKTAPGPALRSCDECGEIANPCWHDGQFNFCRGCVPDELRYPTGKKP